MTSTTSNTKSTVESHKIDAEVSSNYQIRPSLSNSFQVGTVKDIIGDVLQQILDGKEYSQQEVKPWCRQIVKDINTRIKDLEIPRYKHIVQVMLSEKTGAGCRYIARCRWDASCDSKISEMYRSESIVCIVTVFSIYRY